VAQLLPACPHSQCEFHLRPLAAAALHCQQRGQDEPVSHLQRIESSTVAGSQTVSCPILHLWLYAASAAETASLCALAMPSYPSYTLSSKCAIKKRGTGTCVKTRWHTQTRIINFNTHPGLPAPPLQVPPRRCCLTHHYCWTYFPYYSLWRGLRSTCSIVRTG